MQIDRYTKVILTLLTIGVWLLAVAIFIRPAPLQAYGDQQDINLEQIGGASIYGAIPVEVQGTVRIELENGPVFVLEE